MELTDDQIRFATNCVMQWIEMYHIHLKRDPTPADAVHSALLHRLLSGKKPLPKPPPLRFSYPDYALAEGEEVLIMEINKMRVRPEDQALFDEEHKGYDVVVDQHLGWKWINMEGKLDSKGNPISGIMEYKDGTRFRFYRKMVTRKKVDKLASGVSEYQEEASFLQALIKE